LLGILLLLAMLPRESEQRIGPPAPHLSHRASAQWRLSARPAWRAFRQRWGGRWAVRWDERNGTPRFIHAPGPPVSAAQELADDLARLAGVDPGELRLRASRSRGDRQLLSWSRHWRGAEVLGDRIALLAVKGRVAGAWLQLTPVRLTEQPLPGELVLPLPTWRGEPWLGPASGVQPHLVRREERGSLVSFHTRDGRLLHGYDQRRFATVTVSHEERTVGDPMVEHAARQVTVSDSQGVSETTADDGSHGLSGELEVLLDGPTLAVLEDGAEIRVAGSDDMLLEGGADLPLSAASVQHHFHVLWDWLALRWPEHRWLGSHVPADVEITRGACNAYYTSGTINFFVESEGFCNNLGQIADVIYHELGHGVHHYILATGSFAGDVSEGSADFVSATILGDPTLAPNAYPDGSAVRELETDRVYPDDANGEVHNDGLIWGSFLWNLRERWIKTYGEETGVEMTDLLFLGALEQGPTMTDLYEAVVLADDDDGDLSNGTPHGCELVGLLDQHGLGPGPIGVVLFDHEALGPQPSSAEGYEVVFDLHALTPECGDLDESSIQLWYSLEAEAIPGVEEEPEEEPRDDTGEPDTGERDSAPQDSAPGDTGAPEDPYLGWELVEVQASGDSWSATIPRQPATSHLRYFMQASSADGSQTVYTHGGLEHALYEFRIGDREEVWCEGFEDDAEGWEHGAGSPWQPDQSGELTDQWELGAPGGGSFLPDAPWQGGAIAATDLDGFYLPNNLQYLRSPPQQLADLGPMPLLSYQRWLTVEDARYDHATILIEQERLWRNPGTRDGIQHLLDMEWTHCDLSLEGWLEREKESHLTWILESDGGLEYGGWALDQVCLVQLADVAGHYRVDDLQATDDQQQVSISWTQPWMQPLGATALVRRLDDWPTGPDDGVLADLDLHPVPGQQREVLDEDLAPGEVWHYAVFASGPQVEDWYYEAVEGENADLGGVPAEELPDSGVGDSGVVDSGPGVEDQDQEQPGARGRCGCGAAGGGAWGWLGWLAVLVARRRRGCV